MGFYKPSYFEQVLKVWSAANGFLLAFSEFIRGQTSSRLRADVLMKGTIVCNPSFVILKGRLGMRILKLVSRVEQVNMVTIMKLVNPGNLVNMFFLQSKDAKLYGEAGHTGSWRNQTPLHLLETGQVDSFRQWMEAVDGCQR